MWVISLFPNSPQCFSRSPSSCPELECLIVSTPFSGFIVLLLLTACKSRITTRSLPLSSQETIEHSTAVMCWISKPLPPKKKKKMTANTSEFGYKVTESVIGKMRSSLSKMGLQSSVTDSFTRRVKFEQKQRGKMVRRQRLR